MKGRKKKKTEENSTNPLLIVQKREVNDNLSTPPNERPPANGDNSGFSSTNKMLHNISLISPQQVNPFLTTKPIERSNN